jgi:hypothetical protein
MLITKMLMKLLMTGSNFNPESRKKNEIIDLLYYNNDGDYDMEDDE